MDNISNNLEKISPTNLKKLEKYIRSFITKVPQIIVQSRCTEENISTTNYSFENDFLSEPLCVETSLRSAEGDILPLELWQLTSSSPPSPKWRGAQSSSPETVVRHLVTLLKSVTCVTRCTPAFKLVAGQGGATYVLRCRVRRGEPPQVLHLGNQPQQYKIGEVHTPVGTVRVGVAYRRKSEMTFAPQRDPLVLKSDYFERDVSPEGRNNRNRSSPSVGAFARRAPEPSLPELLSRPILRPFHPPAEPRCDVNSNPEPGSDSDDSDFVIVDGGCNEYPSTRPPPFADDPDLSSFFLRAPPLSSLSGTPPSLRAQLLDCDARIQHFELSMLDIDRFVDSVCCQGET